jgi:hypothetical protein
MALILDGIKDKKSLEKMGAKRLWDLYLWAASALALTTISKRTALRALAKRGDPAVVQDIEVLCTLKNRLSDIRRSLQSSTSPPPIKTPGMNPKLHS